MVGLSAVRRGSVCLFLAERHRGAVDVLHRGVHHEVADGDFAVRKAGGVVHGREEDHSFLVAHAMTSDVYVALLAACHLPEAAHFFLNLRRQSMVARGVEF